MRALTPFALAVLMLAVAGGIVGYIRRRIKSAPTPFSHTVAEFWKDQECLRSTN